MTNPQKDILKVLLDDENVNIFSMGFFGPISGVSATLSVSYFLKKRTTTFLITDEVDGEGRMNRRNEFEIKR